MAEAQHTQSESGEEEIGEELELNDPRLMPFMDLPITVAVEFGRVDARVSDVLNWKTGSVITLEKLAGESLEVYMNGRLIAKGEVIVVNDKFGIRLMDIVTPKDQLDHQ